ncbi:hypothetical protein ACMT9Y_15405 [Clavibacter tessellarius]|uniref:hypothetical protein n=1 Tax=Clavibacter tessellarius TaxID=31965 RepID=UPI0039EBE7F4
MQHTNEIVSNYGKEAAKRHLRNATIIGTTISLCLALGVSTSAQAAPSRDLATVLANAAPQGAAVVPLAKDAATTAGDVSVNLPDSGTSSLAVTANGGDVRTNIVLPGQFDTAAGTTLPDGTVTYPDQDRPGDHIAVQLLDDGSTRVQTVLADKNSPKEYAYSMDGFVPVQGVDAEGQDAFGFIGEGKGDTSNYVPVAPAWAKDARGNAVPTRYEVRGDALVQVIEPAVDASFPVVADPAWVWMSGGYGAKLNRIETKRAKVMSGASSICAAMASKIPVNVTIACGAYAGYMLTQAGLADLDKPKSCLFLVVVPAPLILRYHDGHCR